MWKQLNNVIYRDFPEFRYHIEYIVPLEPLLDGTWKAWKIINGLVALEIHEGKLETCLKKCNQDIKDEI